MCAKVSFFKRLFGNICLKKTYDDLEQEFDKYKSDKKLLIDELKSDNDALQEKLKNKENELELALTKLKFHNDLVEEHNSLRATYNQLRVRFNERVTLIKQAKTKTSEPTEVSEELKEKIKRLKYTNKMGFSRIAKAVSLSEQEVRAIAATFTKDK